MEGKDLIEMLENHVLSTMRKIDECRPNGPGASNKEIEEAAGLSLNLPYQDGWLTWSILHSLIEKGYVEAIPVKRGKSKRLRYRLLKY